MAHDADARVNVANPFERNKYIGNNLLILQHNIVDELNKYSIPVHKCKASFAQVDKIYESGRVQTLFNIFSKLYARAIAENALMEIQVKESSSAFKQLESVLRVTASFLSFMQKANVVQERASDLAKPGVARDDYFKALQFSDVWSQEEQQAVAMLDSNNAATVACKVKALEVHMRGARHQLECVFKQFTDLVATAVHYIMNNQGQFAEASFGDIMAGKDSNGVDAYGNGGRALDQLQSTQQFMDFQEKCIVGVDCPKCLRNFNESGGCEDLASGSGSEKLEGNCDECEHFVEAFCKKGKKDSKKDSKASDTPESGQGEGEGEEQMTDLEIHGGAPLRVSMGTYGNTLALRQHAFFGNLEREQQEGSVSLDSTEVPDEKPINLAEVLLFIYNFWMKTQDLVLQFTGSVLTTSICDTAKKQGRDIKDLPSWACAFPCNYQVNMMQEAHIQGLLVYVKDQTRMSFPGREMLITALEAFDKLCVYYHQAWQTLYKIQGDEQFAGENMAAQHICPKENGFKPIQDFGANVFALRSRDLWKYDPGFEFDIPIPAGPVPLVLSLGIGGVFGVRLDTGTCERAGDDPATFYAIAPVLNAALTGKASLGIGFSVFGLGLKVYVGIDVALFSVDVRVAAYFEKEEKKALASLESYQKSSSESLALTTTNMERSEVSEEELKEVCPCLWSSMTANKPELKESCIKICRSLNTLSAAVRSGTTTGSPNAAIVLSVWVDPVWVDFNVGLKILWMDLKYHIYTYVAPRIKIGPEFCYANTESSKKRICPAERKIYSLDSMENTRKFFCYVVDYGALLDGKIQCEQRPGVRQDFTSGFGNLDEVISNCLALPAKSSNSWRTRWTTKGQKKTENPISCSFQ
jgi:hypothetical protein